MSTTERQDTCLHELFERQARRTPQASAVADIYAEISYEDLDRKANKLAGYLRSEGVSRDEIVGIYMEHRAEYIVGMLAALKAGGAFLPLELAYPDSLLTDVIADSRPRVVLTQGAFEDRLPDEQTRLLMDEGWEDNLPDGESSGTKNELDDLVFVAYSSGTTGKPKGIANTHRAAIGSYRWRFGLSDYEPGDRVGCNVFFIWEALRPLLRGGTSVVIPDNVIYDPSALIEFLEDYGITETLMTPSLLEAVLVEGGSDLEDRLSSLKTLWLNGEVVTRTLAERAMELMPQTRLMNVYSVSETHEVAGGDLGELMRNDEAKYCPVGHPADPERLYILDDEMNRVSEGEAGELYVGGELLAREYVNLPQKTAERFVEDPFSPEESARMYRSGDRARMLSDGSLEILGRVDSMQKIRGYSVELGAVETAIEQNLAVNNCVAVVDGEEGEDKRLVAYVVPVSDDEEDDRYADWEIDERTGSSTNIRNTLQESLPHYMVPSVFMELDSLPLQETTGKVDRDRLPDPPLRATRTRNVSTISPDASRQEKEAALAEIWEEVLGLAEGDVRPEDDFFEIGGHSLAAAELVGRVEDAFGRRLTVSAFLENPTLTKFLDRIERKGSGERRTRRDIRSEAVLEAEIQPEGEVTKTRLRDARRIFLTGATGFLGAFLLDGLLTRTNAKVYCLVRPREGSDQLAPIRSSLERYDLWRPGREKRIVPVSGNLGDPLLGMSEENFDALAKSVDLVLHAGAMVNLIYPYDNLKGPNVDGTREVLRLACRHKTKPLHHVSTNGVFPPGRRLCTEDTDLDSLAGGREDGYGQTKWVGEKLVREAESRGLPVSVFRPGNISGHSYSGAANARDFITALMVGSLRLGSAPEMSGWLIEMTPVDFVSGAILEIADRPDEWGKTFHLANPDRLSASELFGLLEDAGYSMDRLHYSDWLKEWRNSEDAKRDDAIGSILHGAGPEAPEIWDDNTYDDRNTRKALQGSGLSHPEIDVELMRNYTRYFVRHGWIEESSGSSLRKSPA